MIQPNWGACLEDIQLIRKFNKGTRFLLRVVGNFNKYAWVVPFREKKKTLQLLTFFKTFHNLDVNQTRYGYIWS